MRAMWSGAVSFGLVNVPVKAYAATENHDVRFHQVHATDGGRIRYERVCSLDGERVDYADIVRGYQTEDGELVVLTEDDLATLPKPTGHEIEVMEFVPADQIDPLLFERSYYLEPDSRAVKPYALLREALVQTDRMAVVKVALRHRESLAVLRVRGPVIVLQTLLWPDEVRSPDFPVLDADVDLRPQELQMASMLVESLGADFDPDRYHDAYRDAVVALIERKRSTGETQPVPVPAAVDDAAAGMSDLLTALQRSVEAIRGQGGPAGAADDEHASRARTSPQTDRDDTRSGRRARRRKPA